MPVNYRKAPFPWFGGKSKAAELVWSLLGDVDSYVEPFAGSLAVLLNRPHPANRTYYSETVNDIDGLLVNAWRGIQMYPQETAVAASWPVSEADKTARQIRLLRWVKDRDLDVLAGDPDYCDPVVAGWWLWAVSVQIGAFHGEGPWTADPVTGRIVKQERGAGREPGVMRNRPDMNNNGKGVNRPQLREPGVSRDLPDLSNDGRGVNRPQLREPGVFRALPHLTDNGQGVNHAGTREPGVSRDLPHLGDNGRGVNHASTREPGVVEEDYGFHPTTMPELRRWFAYLSARLRHVRILNGDWSRLVTTGASHTINVRMGGHVGVFLDPPYDQEIRAGNLYSHDRAGVAGDVLRWCVANGDNPRKRIVLAGYTGEHDLLVGHGWTEHEWYTKGWLTGGYGAAGESQAPMERLWSSPHCLHTAPVVGGVQEGLFV